MASGDVITGLYIVPTIFQPAVGVEIMVTAFGQNNNINVNMNDGTNSIYFLGSTDAGDATKGNIKVGITNTFYLDMKGANVNLFTGIQIK
tara:strand:+ start:290 stop:559 length:270 start_codon:yes stop_codon:yes gene_type:complete